jgi:hypothetical protein
MLPPDESFLAEVQSGDIDGLADNSEKEMLLVALRFYFGAAQWWNAVVQEGLGPLRFDFGPARSWNAVVEDLGFPPGGGNGHPVADQIKLYATRQDNPRTIDFSQFGSAAHEDHLPSYFLYETHNNLMLYVGPDFYHGQSELAVINTLVLDKQRRPLQSHTMDFGFIDVGTHEVSQGLNGPSPAELRPDSLVGSPDPSEKKMLLAALRFYFGPAQWWKALTKDKLTQDDLNNLNGALRKPGERYELLEQQTDLGQGYFGRDHQATDQVKLYAATNTRNNPDRLPSYFLYEESHNLTFYVGPDFLHNRPNIKVINTLVLDEYYLARESHTIDFGCMP